MVLPSRLYLLLLTRSRHLYPDLSWLQASCLGASPALSMSSWLLLRYSGAVCTGAPSILARSVSGTMIHLSWVVSLQWPFHLYPTFAMVAGSCVPSGTPVALVCPPCGVTVKFYLRFSVFTFHPFLRVRCLRMLLRSFQLSSAECVLRPHTWDLSLVLPIYSHRPLSLCLRLTSALSR